MEPENYTLHKLKNGDAIPFDLLLLADETKDAIEKYIYDSDIYTVFTKGNLNPIGVVVLYNINDSEVEIKNIAILESFRSQGIGSFLIKKIKEIALKQNYKEIIVGTADGAIKEIQFYEKNGFKKYDVKKNFFIENYSQPIIENGIMLKDMIMLKTQIV
jgi:ribosomal protein S18 acetylase RimI-like enzyme